MHSVRVHPASSTSPADQSLCIFVLSYHNASQKAALMRSVNMRPTSSTFPAHQSLCIFVLSYHSASQKTALMRSVNMQPTSSTFPAHQSLCIFVLSYHRRQHWYALLTCNQHHQLFQHTSHYVFLFSCQGALLKAAFVCCDMLDLTSSASLAEQLTSRYGGGFEMQSWSNLPTGSGMGWLRYW